MSEERWLLACSTIGCVFTGAGRALDIPLEVYILASILLCLPKKSLYFVSADLQITGALLYLVTVGVWMNDTSLASGGEKQRCIKTIGWALAVGLSGKNRYTYFHNTFRNRRWLSQWNTEPICRLQKFKYKV